MLMKSQLVLNNPNAIIAVMSTCVDMTVESLKLTESSSDPDTEKIRSASIIEFNIVQGVAQTAIEIVPVLTEPWVTMRLNLPITRFNI